MRRISCYPRMTLACLLDQMIGCHVKAVCDWHDRWLIRCMDREDDA